MGQGYGKKVDTNQPLIVEELREVGFSVRSTASVGHGFADIIVGYQGLNFLFEIKTDDKGKLTEDEFEFFEEWDGQTDVIYRTEQIFAAIKETFNRFIGLDAMAGLGELYQRELALARYRIVKMEKARKKEERAAKRKAKQ